jgi:hypothetical protein
LGVVLEKRIKTKVKSKKRRGNKKKRQKNKKHPI